MFIVRNNRLDKRNSPLCLDEPEAQIKHIFTVITAFIQRQFDILNTY